MQNFVHLENLKLFRKLLTETADPQQREVLVKLLAVEESNDKQPLRKKQG